MTEAMIWVAYATPEQQFHIAVPFQPGMTALDAIEQSGIRAQVELTEPLSLGFLALSYRIIPSHWQQGIG